MIIHTNLAKLQKQDPTLFSENFNILVETGSMSFFESTNKVKAKIYQMISDIKLCKVYEDMTNKLQLSSEPTGD